MHADLHANGPYDVLVGIHSCIDRKAQNPLHLMADQSILRCRGLTEQQCWQQAMQTLEEIVPQHITSGTAKRSGLFVHAAAQAILNLRAHMFKHVLAC